MSKREFPSFTRREVLAALAGAGAVSPFALSTSSAAQAPRAPSNVRIGNSASSSAGKAVLTPNDLVYRGFIRLSSDAGGLWYADGKIALRKVNGQTRAFVVGDRTQKDPVFEFILPDNPNPNMKAAPVAALARNWGEVMKGRMITGGSEGAYAGGLYWDEGMNALWWSYGPIYVPIRSHPTIGCSILDDATGTATSFGPWRTEWSSQRTRGAFCPIPSWFSSSYLSGKNVGIMASQTSGNKLAPFGAILSGMKLPDPTKTKPDVMTDDHWTIANHGVLLHDIDHRQARDTKYRTCGWKQAYDCRAGATVRDNPGLFGGADPAGGENDTMNACVWIDLPDKHGLLYFGQLVTTPEGYTAPGDPDGYVHMWYGAPIRTDGSAPKTCCHGQDDPWWIATGPGAHYRVPMGWIYNPMDLVDTAKNKADLWSRTPASTFQWKKYFPDVRDRPGSGMWSGAAFDPETRRIYALVKYHDAVTAPPNSRPAIVVFDVK